MGLAKTATLVRLSLIRLQRQLTLEELARQSGLTKSYLSKIERGRSAPSIATVVKLARALNLNVGDLVGDGELSGSLCIERRGARPPFHPAGPAGYKFEPIAASRRFKQMEPFVLRPRKTLPPDVVLTEHEGEELIFVVSGRIEVVFTDQTVKLGKGDSVYLDSSMRHRLCSIGKQQAEVLVVIGRNFHQRSRKRRRDDDGATVRRIK